MVKNERYPKISTHMGLIAFIPHFTIGECSDFLNVAKKVESYREEPYREHFEFASVFYDASGLHGRNSLELATVFTITGYNVSNCRGGKNYMEQTEISKTVI